MIFFRADSLFDDVRSKQRHDLAPIFLKKEKLCELLPRRKTKKKNYSNIILHFDDSISETQHHNKLGFKHTIYYLAL